MSDYMRGLRARVGHGLLCVPTVGVAVLDDARRVLLVRHAEGDDWTTPGGMVEPLETPADAAVRETWEETGLHVELTDVLGVFGGPLLATTYRNGDEIAWIATLFAARVLAGSPRPDGVETLEVRYVSLGEIGGLRCKPHLALFLPAIWTPGAGPAFEPATWRPPV